MRKLGRLLMLLFSIALLAPLAHWGYNLAQRYLGASFLAPEGAISVRSFELDDEQWTKYYLPSRAKRVRALITVGLIEQPTPAARAGKIEYRLVDRNDRVLNTGSFTFQAKPPGIGNADNGSRLTPYLPYQDTTPYGDQDYYLDIGPFPEAHQLHFRLAGAEADIAWVGVRLAFRIQRSVEDARLQWQRLRKEQQEELAAPSIVPVGLLYPEQRYALLQQDWEQVGPLGVENSDYRELRLYRFKTPPVLGGEATDELVQALYLDSRHWGSIPLTGTEADGTLVLRAYGSSGHSLEAMFFAGLEKLPRRYAIELPASGEALQWQPPREPGLLWLKAKGPVTVTELRPNEAEQSPQGLYQTLWTLGPDQPLTYRVHHRDKAATPMRIDLRNTLPASNPGVSYRALDHAGNALLTGTLEHDKGASYFDRLMPFDSARAVTEPTSYFLELPDTVASLELHSSGPALASVFSRPQDLPHRRQIPEEQVSWLAGDETQPGWFTVAPANAAALVERRESLLWHFRPPQGSLEITSEPRYWQDFQPQGTALTGRRVYLPRLPTEQDSSALQEILFRPLAPGVNPVVFGTRDYARAVRPELLVVRDTAAPGRLSIRLDGQLHHSQSIASKVLRVSLPQVALGKHRLQVQGLNGRAYLNHLSQSPVPDEEGQLSRLAWQIPATGLEFVIDKQAGEELVNLQLFSRNANLQPLTLDVSLLDGQQRFPSTGYTFRRRTYLIAADSSQGFAAVEQTDDARAAIYPRVVVPLADDLPAGPITLRIRASAGQTFVLVSRVTEGVTERFQLFTEDVDSPGDN